MWNFSLGPKNRNRNSAKILGYTRGHSAMPVDQVPDSCEKPPPLRRRRFSPSTLRAALPQRPARRDALRHNALILLVNFMLFLSCPYFNPHLASAIAMAAPSSWPSRYAPHLSSSGRARCASKGSLDAGHGADNTSYSSLRSILSRQRPLKPAYIAPVSDRCRVLVWPAFYLNCGAIEVCVALFVHSSLPAVLRKSL